MSKSIDSKQKTGRNRTDNTEPPFGDGRHRTANAPQSTTDPTRRDRLRSWVERLQHLGRFERYGLAGVFVCVAVAAIGVYQVLNASSVLLVAVFEAVVTGLLLATVIVLTVNGSDGTNTDEFTRSDSDQSSLEQWRRGRRRP